MGTITIISRALVVSVPGLLIALPAQAHVKWFTEPTTDVTPLALDTYVLVGSLIALSAALTTARWLDGATRHHALTPLWSDQPFHGVYGLIALYFLGAALTHTFLAPHVAVCSHWTYAGIAAQLFIYSALLLNRARLCAGLLLVALFVVASWQDPIFALEYPLLLGVAWVIAFAKHRPTPVDVAIVRVLLGVSLVTLAFTEKLADPTRALILLETYNFNFMQLLGFNYSHGLFVYSAGLVELQLGLLLVLGWVPRLAVAALAAFMVATNSFFFALGEYYLGWVELIGHLPIFAACLLVLCYHPVAHRSPVYGIAPARVGYW
ncbi:DoxX family membrane protein [Marinimicrobium alkaliphilum]|uniref:DoxX family membrane protein n=1 Tax=Marinimicrobium alkaliphilum TaxID=2202654 RepID=UPI000DBACEBB|nr:DoxX family membrane protein [Marinimicrobium alkaliphilum]